MSRPRVASIVSRDDEEDEPSNPSKGGGGYEVQDERMREELMLEKKFQIKEVIIKGEILVQYFMLSALLHS